MAKSDTVIKRIKRVKDGIKTALGVEKDIIQLGFPLNPQIKNTLFPDNYIITNNELIKKRTEEFRGSVIELHYQTINEFNELTKKDKSDARKFIKDLRKKDYRFMIHHPFLYQKGPEHFNMDFAWLTIPKNHKINNIQELPLDVCKSFLEFSNYLDIRNITFHATKPIEVGKNKELLYLLDKEDFGDFSNKIEELTDYIHKKKLDVEIAVETGGITRANLIDLHMKYGTNINLDTAHLFLDLDAMYHDTMSNVKKDEATTIFFKENRNFIPQLHLTQFNKGDEHLPINEKGRLNCNKDILRIIQNDYETSGKDYLVMIESEIVDKDKEYVRNAISDVQYFGFGNAVVNVFMGAPASGKTKGAKALRRLVGKTTSSDAERKFYDEAMSQDYVVSEKYKDRVYNELFDGLSSKIKHGNPGSNIEATFNFKSRRARLYDLLMKYPTKDIYFWNFIRSEKDCKKRLEDRAKEKARAEATGKKFPENVLYSYSIYKGFTNKKNGDERPSVFSMNEVPTILRDRIHVVNYDTSKQVISVDNPDNKTKKGVEKLVKYANKHGHSPVIKA